MPAMSRSRDYRGSISTLAAMRRAALLLFGFSLLASACVAGGENVVSPDNGLVTVTSLPEVQTSTTVPGDSSSTTTPSPG